MTSRVLLAIADDDLANEVRVLVEESSHLDVVGVATTGPAVIGACEQGDLDVVLVHEGLGPLPLLHLTRDIGTRFPGLGIVLLVDEASAEVLRGALQAGARGVVGLPLSVDALEADLRGAAEWSRSVRAQFSGERHDQAAESGSARMVAVAGAKGGVGTTTIALHLALEAAQQLSPMRSVCLVDFDLQTGDIVNLLDLEHRRSVIDLLEVADDLDARHLEESMFRHPTGLELLLAPAEGEQAEDVTGGHARQILGAVRSRFDVVIVDVGSVVTEGSAVATELADAVLLVTTPDVPSMRAANRLLQLWERLDVRKDDVEVVINRASRISDVQPELVESVIDAPRVPLTIPADYKEMQPAVNSGSPARVQDGEVRRAIAGLGVHLGMWQPERRSGSTRRLLGRRESGQAAVEFVGVLPFALLIVALAFQMTLVGLSFLFAGHAASEGARQLAVGAPVAVAADHARDRIPSRWASSLELRPQGSGGSGQAYVQARVRIPMIVPGISPDVRVSSTSGYVREDVVRGRRP